MGWNELRLKNPFNRFKRMYDSSYGGANEGEAAPSEDSGLPDAPSSSSNDGGSGTNLGDTYNAITGVNSDSGIGDSPTSSIPVIFGSSSYTSPDDPGRYQTLYDPASQEYVQNPSFGVGGAAGQAIRDESIRASIAANKTQNVQYNPYAPNSYASAIGAISKEVYSRQQDADPSYSYAAQTRARELEIQRGAGSMLFPTLGVQKISNGEYINSITGSRIGVGETWVNTPYGAQKIDAAATPREQIGLNIALWGAAVPSASQLNLNSSDLKSLGQNKNYNALSASFLAAGTPQEYKAGTVSDKTGSIFTGTGWASPSSSVFRSAGSGVDSKGLINNAYTNPNAFKSFSDYEVNGAAGSSGKGASYDMAMEAERKGEKLDYGVSQIAKNQGFMPGAGGWAALLQTDDKGNVFSGISTVPSRNDPYNNEFGSMVTEDGRTIYRPNPKYADPLANVFKAPGEEGATKSNDPVYYPAGRGVVSIIEGTKTEPTYDRMNPFAETQETWVLPYGHSVPQRIGGVGLGGLGSGQFSFGQDAPTNAVLNRGYIAADYSDPKAWNNRSFGNYLQVAKASVAGSQRYTEVGANLYGGIGGIDTEVFKLKLSSPGNPLQPVGSNYPSYNDKVWSGDGWVANTAPRTFGNTTTPDPRGSREKVGGWWADALVGGDLNARMNTKESPMLFQKDYMDTSVGTVTSGRQALSTVGRDNTNFANLLDYEASSAKIDANKGSFVGVDTLKNYGYVSNDGVARWVPNPKPMTELYSKPDITYKTNPNARITEDRIILGGIKEVPDPDKPGQTKLIREQDTVIKGGDTVFPEILNNPKYALAFGVTTDKMTMDDKRLNWQNDLAYNEMIKEMVSDKTRGLKADEVTWILPGGTGERAVVGGGTMPVNVEGKSAGGDLKLERDLYAGTPFANGAVASTKKYVSMNAGANAGGSAFTPTASSTPPVKTDGLFDGLTNSLGAGGNAIRNNIPEWTYPVTDALAEGSNYVRALSPIVTNPVFGSTQAAANVNQIWKEDANRYSSLSGAATHAQNQEMSFFNREKYIVGDAKTDAYYGENYGGHGFVDPIMPSNIPAGASLADIHTHNDPFPGASMFGYTAVASKNDLMYKTPGSVQSSVITEKGVLTYNSSVGASEGYKSSNPIGTFSMGVGAQDAAFKESGIDYNLEGKYTPLGGKTTPPRNVLYDAANFGNTAVGAFNTARNTMSDPGAGKLLEGQTRRDIEMPPTKINPAYEIANFGNNVFSGAKRGAVAMAAPAVVQATIFNEAAIAVTGKSSTGGNTVPSDVPMSYGAIKTIEKGYEGVWGMQTSLLPDWVPVPRPPATVGSDTPIRQELVSTTLSGGNETITKKGQWLDQQSSWFTNPKNDPDLTNEKQVNAYNRNVDLYNTEVDVYTKMQEQNPVVETKTYKQVGTPDETAWQHSSGQVGDWIRKSAYGGITDEQMATRYENTAKQEGLGKYPMLLRYGFEQQMVRDPLVVVSAAALTGEAYVATELIGAGVVSYGGSSLPLAGAAKVLTTPGAGGVAGTVARVAYDNVGRVALTAYYGGEVTEWGKATPEKTVYNVGGTIPALISSGGTYMGMKSAAVRFSPAPATPQPTTQPPSSGTNKKGGGGGTGGSGSGGVGTVTQTKLAGFNLPMNAIYQAPSKLSGAGRFAGVMGYGSELPAQLPIVNEITPRSINTPEIVAKKREVAEIPAILPKSGNEVVYRNINTPEHNFDDYVNRNTFDNKNANLYDNKNKNVNLYENKNNNAYENPNKNWWENRNQFGLPVIDGNAYGNPNKVINDVVNPTKNKFVNSNKYSFADQTIFANPVGFVNPVGFGYKYEQVTKAPPPPPKPKPVPIIPPLGFDFRPGSSQPSGGGNRGRGAHREVIGIRSSLEEFYGKHISQLTRRRTRR